MISSHYSNIPPPSLPPPQLSLPLSEFYATITSFLSTDYLHSRPLILPSVSPARFAHFRSWCQSRGKRLRYAYDDTTHTLTLRGTQTQLHAVLNAWLSSVYMRLRDTLTPTELLHAQLLSSYDVELSAGVQQPDAAFVYLRPGPGPGDEWTCDPFPRVVFEVAFKQRRYSDVLSAARTWLMGSEGGVEAVVVVNIEEGPIAEQQQQEEGVVEQREEEGGSPPFSVREKHRSCETEKWVGELTGTVEIFRREGEEMRRDGMAYTLLPRTPGPEPSLRISDLLADTARDDARTVVLPLEPYRRLIGSTVKNLAVARKALTSRGRKTARGEECGVAGELFVPETQGEEGEEEEVKGARVRKESGFCGEQRVGGARGRE